LGKFRSPGGVGGFEKLFFVVFVNHSFYVSPLRSVEVCADVQCAPASVSGSCIVLVRSPPCPLCSHHGTCLHGAPLLLLLSSWLEEESSSMGCVALPCLRTTYIPIPSFENSSTSTCSQWQGVRHYLKPLAPKDLLVCMRLQFVGGSVGTRPIAPNAQLKHAAGQPKEEVPSPRSYSSKGAGWSVQRGREYEESYDGGFTVGDHQETGYFG